MENYQEFLDRINSFEKPDTYYGEDYFHGNPSIAHKVDWENHFRPFYGDTMVFDLDHDAKEKIAECVDILFQMVPECFCDRLIYNTFHLTLHDLSNSPNLYDVAAEVFENELKVIEKRKEVPNFQTIKMKSKYIFNMVGTSLVLGLYPADEEEYEKLMNLYYLFDDVKKLGYPLTPHITLAYYNVHGFTTESARKLEEFIREWNKKELKIELNTSHLYYQKFTNMNHYVNILCMGQE